MGCAFVVLLSSEWRQRELIILLSARELLAQGHHEFKPGRRLRREMFKIRNRLHRKRRPAGTPPRENRAKSKRQGRRLRENFDGLVQQRTESALRCAPANSVLCWLGRRLITQSFCFSIVILASGVCGTFVSMELNGTSVLSICDAMA